MIKQLFSDHSLGDLWKVIHQITVSGVSKHSHHWTLSISSNLYVTEECRNSYQLPLQVAVLALQFSDAHTRLCKSPLQVFTPVSGRHIMNYHT